MSKDDPSMKRYQTIIILFIFVLVFNGLQMVFLNADSKPYDSLMDMGNQNTAYDEKLLNDVEPEPEPIVTSTTNKPKKTNAGIGDYFSLWLNSGRVAYAGAEDIYEDVQVWSVKQVTPVVDTYLTVSSAIASVSDFVGFFFGGFILKAVELPVWMAIIVTPIYIILIVTFWYIVIDFIKDIEILGSSI